MTKIWLDDIRHPAAFGYVGWIWVKTADDCITYLNTFWDEITEISLDHDLGPRSTAGIEDHGERTGYDVAKWIEERVIVDGWKMPVIHCHSQNPAGKKRIESALINATRHAVGR